MSNGAGYPRQPKDDYLTEVEMQGFPTPSAGNLHIIPLPPGSYQTTMVVPPGGNQPHVVVSPARGTWMTLPQRIANCPPGLEYLTMIDQLLVKQKMEILEAFSEFETKNKYVIRNSMDQNVYMAFEGSDFCSRECFADLRPFDMKIVDNFKNEVIRLHRPLACKYCCCPCSLQFLEVFAPPGQLIGRVKQNWSVWKSDFSIENAAGDTVLKIQGPVCACGMCSDVEFEVVDPDGITQVGKIAKQWSGLAKEYYTDTDNFGITFPMDLDVRTKAVMLGAVFLIDFMFFEEL